MCAECSLTKMDGLVLAVPITILVIFGITSNLMFLFVVARVNGIRRNSINNYLVSMAIADLLFLSLNKFALYGLLGSNEKLLLIGFAVNIVPEIVTELMMPLVAYDWYKAICYPTETFATRCTNQRALLYVGISWVISFVAILPMCFGLGASEESAYFKLKSVSLLPYVASLIASGVLYYAIIRKVNGEMTRLKEQPSTVQITVMARNQIIKMLIANTVAFFLLQLPSKTNIFYRTMVSFTAPDAAFEDHDSQVWWLVSEIALLLNSAINPIVYTVGSVRYRKAFFKAFSFCFKCCGCSDLVDTDTTTENSRANVTCDLSKGKSSCVVHVEQNSTAQSYGRDATEFEPSEGDI